MAYSKYGLSFKNFTDSYGEWEANGGVEQANKAIDFKNLQNNSFNVRGLPGGTFGQSVIDSTLGVAGNIDDFLGGPTGLGDYANNYVTAQEMAMGEKPKADFSWDYLINGLPRDTGNLIGSGIGLAVPTAAAALAAPFVGTAGAATAAVGGALAAAGLESMAEGGQKMRDSLANGDSLETAQNKARTVASKNMLLLAPTNLLGLGALKKVGQGLKTAYNGGKAVSATGGALANYPKLSQVADFAKGAGWAGLGAMNEGAQEAWQQGIQDSVEPDTDWGILPWNWNDEQTEAFESTIGPTALMAGVGGGARLAARKLGMSDVPQVDTAPQVNNNLFGAGTAEISTQGADIDEQVAHLKDGYQSVIPQVAGVLVNDFGIEGAQISSGFRTREHNKEVGGAENSYHVGDGEHGDALDIVLPDGTSAETAEAIKQRFENSGVFDEVLFHDAGSGYHLHLGGLKTDNIGNSYGSYSGNADVDSAINEMAEKYNLDPALLAAIAEQESGFNQSAQSEAGAMGIMQLMPGTAEGLGVDPSDLRGNLEGGAKYLRQMLDKYDGDVEKALAAYNAGPGSLDSVNGDISQLSGETQKYVPSVMERYNKFKNKSGGGISSSGNILDWDSTNEDFSKLDFFPKDGEQSQGTVNEFLENLAKLEESDDKAAKEKGRQAQDILQQYGDDTEKLTEKAKELGYQQTVDPAEVHGRIPMRRIVSTALNNGQVTFATKKAADIFASSPIGQTMERQGKTFKVTDNFKMNEQVNAISQQIYPGNTAKTKTVSNGVTPDVASQENNTNKPLTTEEVNSINEVFQSMPPALKERIQNMMAGKKYDHVRAAMQKFINNPAYSPLSAQEVDSPNKALQTMPEELRSKIYSMMVKRVGDALNALLNIPEAMSNSTSTRIDGNKVRSYIESGNLPMMNRAINAMSQNLREHGMDPQKALGIYDVNTLPAVQEVDSPNKALQTMPEELRSKIYSMMVKRVGDALNALLNIPEAMSNSTSTRIDGNKVRSYIESGNLPMMNRAINAMSQNLREHGMDPQKALGIYDVNTLPAVQGERMPSTDVQREEPAIEGTVEDTVITPPYNGKPAYNENQLEAPAIESDHLNSEDFLAGLSPVERGFMEYLDKMFDNLQLGFNDVLEYLRARQKDIFDKRMESVIQQGPQGLTGAFYTNGGKMVVDNNMPQEVQNAWNQLLSMRKNFGASLANSTAEIQNEYMRVESVVKDYLTTAVTEQCKNNVSWRKLNYAITGLEAIADKARRYERSVSEEGKRGSTKSYRDVSAEEGQAIEDSAVAWSGAIHQYGTTETRLRSFLNTLGSNFTKNNHGMALRAKTKYKGQPMNKAGRIEALIRDGGRVEERGKEYFAVSPNGDETKVTKGEHNYYKWLRQNGFAQQDRAPEGAPQLTENNGVIEDSYRARQPEYNGKESHEEDVKKEESTKGQTKPQSNDNPNASNEPMRKELIEQAAANEDTWVNSKKSELHLEDDNDTVVKLTPQELKYYQDLIKKSVVAKPELYEEAQEDVGEMDDNVEMSKEQKQLYDESSDDRDMPSVEDEAEPTTDEPRTKYSREKSPVDEKNNQQEIEPINPHSAESLKENGNSNTELDRLPKVPIAKLRQSEQKIVRFGKAIGVPVHFVESSDMTNRGVFTHNGEIFINRKAKVPAHSIFVHEFVHWLKASPENAGAYDVLHACLENSNGLFNEARINKYRGKIFDGNKMSDEEIVEEIVCDAMTHTESAEKLMRAVNNVDGDLATRIAGCLKAMWDKFCEYMNFKQHKISNEQHLPNELSVAEFQRADTAFNKILMNLKNDNGEPVFHRVGTELLLRDTNAKPVEAYRINPISYTYAFASADNNPNRISPREQDIQYMSAVKAYQNESDPAKKESMLDKIRDMVQQAAKTAGFENAIPEQTRAYTVRTKPAPKKTKKVYKVFTVDDKGRPSALFVSSKDTLPQNVWLDANDTFAFTDNNNGRKYIPSTKNPNSKGGATGDSRKTENISAEELAKLEELGYIKRNKQGQYPKTITALAYRPGWHAGDLPFFPQGGKQGDGTTNYKNIHRYNQVVFECEIAYDKDYTNSTVNKKGQIVYSDRQEMPTDGGYKFATNPMTSQNDLGNWYISGSLKIGRALTEEECNKILAKNGFKPQEWQAYGSGNDFVLGKLDLEKLGYTGEEFDAARKTLAPITYDDNGNIIPLSQRFNPNINDVRYSRELKHSKQGAFLMPENGKPYTMSYYHNTQPSPKMAGDMFAQSIEPAGEYIAHDTMNGSNQIPGFEYGKISFKSPLVLEHKSTGHGGWKTDLSNMFGGKKGKALSNAIKKAGHDGIITIDSKTGEILETVNLAGTKNNGNKYSRGVDLSPSTDGVAIAARANNNLVANMKGIVKKANAKFNPFHHEDLENLRIDKRDEEKDLNLIEYQFVSPTREGKKYKVILPFIMKGKQAMAKQEKLRFEFNEGMNEVDKLLGWREGFHRNDSKFKERKEALNEILLKGDLEGKEFTNDELIKAGYDTETIKGYRKMRALLDKAWKLANDTKSRIKYQSITSSTMRRAEADFADLKDKNPFAEIISKVRNPDGTVTINYKAPHVRRVAKQTVLPSELENLRKNKDVHIVGTTQSLKGTTQVTYYQREAGMGKLKGYIPHVFHGWYVCKVDKDGKAIVDEDGNVAMDNIVTTANSLSEAAKLGRELAKANPNANYRVIPQMFSAPGAQEQAIVMGDFDYAKIVGKVADSMSMSITDAQAMLDNTVKMKNRGRFYGYAKQRKGFKGFEQNVYLATMKYFNQTARYAAMDSFKRDSISMYNRIFGAFDDENVTKRSAMAKWTKQYISDMNGTPTWIEKMINNTLHNFGLGEERAGGRPALWLQQKIFTYPMTILKLGVFNPSSALLNLTQLFNLYGAMGEKVLSPQAYQRLLHKGFADTFRAMNNKDSELGRLLWKDLGLDYQIGMDVASGYSNAEVNNLASLRGFAGRLAGKSMYLFRQSDAFARGVTLLTAYNKALDEGKSKAEAIEYAKQINDKVNFDYSVADEPTIFRALGPISKVFLQFKKYPVKQLELFQDFYLDGRELGLNRKQSFLRMVKYMAPYMAMSGMMGIPFISLAGGLLSYFAGIATGDDDWDWEKKAKQFMITEFGEDCPLTQWWLYGAGSFIGLNLGSRVSVGDFLGSDSYNSADGLGGLMWNQTTLGSTVNQVRKQLSYRNYAEALKAINPTLGNIALAYKGEVRTTRGRMKYQYQNMAERMWRAIGFTPLNETLAGDLASNEYAEKQEQTKAKQKAIDDFLADPSSENAARLNELGVTPKSLENESARRTMNRHQLNELAKEKEEAKKKKKPKTYSASDYLKAVQ